MPPTEDPIETPKEFTPEVTYKLTERLAKNVVDMKKTLGEQIGTVAEQQEVLKRQMAEFEQNMKAAPKQVKWEESDVEALRFDPTPDGLNRMLTTKPNGPKPLVEQAENVQRAADVFMCVRAAMAAAKNKAVSELTEREVRELKSYKAFEKSLKDFGRALNTGTALEGGNWVPESMSAQVMEKLKLAEVVMSYFPVIQSQTQLYRYPFKLRFPVAQRAPQLTGSGVYGGIGGGANPYTNLAGAAAYGTNSYTDRKTFDTGKKLRFLELATDEADEDMIIPAVQGLIDDIGMAMDRGWETAGINGDTSATHQDNDITGAPTGVTPETLLDGLRRFYLQQSTPAVVSASASPTIAQIQSVRVKMGIFGAASMRSFLKLFVSATGMLHLMMNKRVMTLDMFGVNATLPAGFLGRVMGIDIIESNFVRDDLHTDGKNNATPGNNINTLFLLANTIGWKRVRRAGYGPVVETERLAAIGATMIVGWDRGDFGYIGTSGASGDKCVGAIHGVPAGTITAQDG